MDLTLRQMRHVIAIADTASFSKAAAAHGITQPALSKSIQNLERDIGFRIFDRGRGGVIPTVLGCSVITEARRLLNHARGLEMQFRHLAGAEEGKAAFGLGPAIANILLAKILAQVVHERPKLQVNALVRPAATLLTALKEGEIEFYLTADVLAPDGPNFDVRTLWEYGFGLYVRYGHPLMGRALDISNLAGFAIGSGKGRPQTPVRLPGGSLNVTVECDEFWSMRNATMASDMIWMTNESQHLLDDISKNNISKLNIDCSSIATMTSFVTIKGKSISPQGKYISNIIDNLKT